MDTTKKSINYIIVGDHKAGGAVCAERNKMLFFTQIPPKEGSQDSALINIISDTSSSIVPFHEKSRSTLQLETPPFMYIASPPVMATFTDKGFKESSSRYNAVTSR